MPSDQTCLSALVVVALGVFLIGLLFLPVPQPNLTIAVAVVSGLLGFIGGTQSTPKSAKAPDAQQGPNP